MNVAGGDLNWVGTLNDSQFQQSLRRMEQGVNRAGSNIVNQGFQIESFAKKAAAAAAGFFSIQAAEGFITSLVSVRSQFQQLDIAFSTMLKSKVAADTLMKELITFAGTTPFGLKDAAGAAKQLLAYGSTAKTVVGELRMLGDVASGVSVPIGDLVYLYGTLKTQGRAYAMDIRQFAGRGIPIYAELAKVLKINTDQVAGFVEAGKVGFKDVEQAFKNMTNAGGMFGGLMEAQSKTLSGQIERLKDAWDLMLNDIGKSNESVLFGSIGLASKLVENYQSILDILQILIITYGTYRAAVALTTVVSLTTVEASVGVTTAMKLQYLWLNLTSKAQRILNATMLANPYVAVATAVAGLVSAMYIYNRSVDDAANAQKKVNEAIDEGKNSVMAETVKIKDSIKAINDNTAALTVKKGAVNDLRKIMPDHLKAYSDEEILAGKATTAIMAYNDALVNSAISKSLFDQKVKIELEKIKAQNMKIDDEDTGFGLTEIIFKNKSFNEYKKDQIRAQDELLKANEAAIKSHNEKIAELNKKEEAKPVVQNKKFYEDLVSGIQGQIDGLDKLDKDFASKKSALISKLKTAKSGVAAFDTSDKQANRDFDQAKRHSEMLQKIYEVNEKYNNKSLTDDEQKLAEIRSQYKSLQHDIDTYNKDPKNKKVNANLKPAIEKAIENQQYENDTKKLQVELDKQKQQYADYEEYKTSLGKTAADSRFKTEIDTSITYLQKLEAERGKLLEKDPTNMSGAEKERLNDLDVRINAEVKAEQKKYDDLVKSLLSYEQERKLLTEQYNLEFARLQDEGNLAAQVVLTKNYKEQLNTLDDANVQKLDSYKLLAEGIDQLSDSSAKRVIASAKRMLAEQVASGKISAELSKEIGKLIKDSEDSLAERLPARLINIANQIDGIASAVGGVDEAFGKVLGTLGNVLGQVGNIKKGMADFKSAGEKGDTLGQLGAGLGIVGAGISIFKSVFSLFDRSQEREEQAAYARDLQNKQTEALNKSLERQIALLNDAYGTDRLLKYNEAIKQATDNQAKYQDQLKNKYALTGDKTADKFIEELNRTGKVGVLAMAGDKALQKFKDQLTALPEDLNQLQRLLDEGKLDANTSVIVQNLIKAGEAASKLKNELNAENVGSSLSQIADDFIKTLTDGTQDFGKSVEDTIRTSILNGFKGKLIQEQLQAFYTQFAELSAGGLTQDEISALRDSYSKAAEKAKQDILDLEKATGIDLSGDSSSTKKIGISGAIVGEALKEDTANRMLGLNQGMYDEIKRQGAVNQNYFNMAVQNFRVQVMIEQNTFRTANNTDKLNEKLDAIIGNTKPSSGSSLDQALRDGGIKI